MLSIEIDNLRNFIFTDIFIFMDNLQSVTDVSEIYMSYFFSSVLGQFPHVDTEVGRVWFPK